MIPIEEVISFVENKQVIIVGNSDSIIKSDHSALIDSFDVVVRINHAVPQKTIGTKTDIWGQFYLDTLPQWSEYNKFNPKYILKNNDIIDFRLKNKFSLIKIPNEQLKAHFETFTPSSGILLISFFSVYTKAKITIIGFDNFITKTFYNKKDVAHKWHNGEKEKLWIEKMINENKNVEILSV